MADLESSLEQHGVEAPDIQPESPEGEIAVVLPIECEADAPCEEQEDEDQFECIPEDDTPGEALPIEEDLPEDPSHNEPPDPESNEPDKEEYPDEPTPGGAVRIEPPDTQYDY